MIKQRGALNQFSTRLSLYQVELNLVSHRHFCLGFEPFAAISVLLSSGGNLFATIGAVFSFHMMIWYKRTFIDFDLNHKYRHFSKSYVSSIKFKMVQIIHEPPKNPAILIEPRRRPQLFCCLGRIRYHARNPRFIHASLRHIQSAQRFG